jgi:hypothetical protein
MKTPRLTSAQLKSLKDLRNELEGRLPPTILTRTAPGRLARWLRSPGFRKRVEALMEVVRFRQDNAIELGATRAAEQISASLDDPAGLQPTECRCHIAIVRLGLAARSPAMRRQRTAENSENGPNAKILQPPAADTPQPAPVHDDVSAEEARALVLRLTEGRQ